MFAHDLRYDSSLLLSAALPALLAACGGVPEIDLAEVAGKTAALSDGPRDIPDALKVSPDEKLKLQVTSVGVQIYTCTATVTLGVTSYAYVFKAPEADLLNDDGRFVDNHFLGPTWQYRDGSKVVGTVKAKGAASEPDAIPWLLLSAVSTGGPGKLADVTSVQRLHTSGGVTPATGCDAAHVGTDVRVPYSADLLGMDAHAIDVGAVAAALVAEHVGAFVSLVALDDQCMRTGEEAVEEAQSGHGGLCRVAFWAQAFLSGVVSPADG